MRVHAIFALAAIAGCAPPAVSDPNAVAPNYDRWQATVAKPPTAVFDIAMRVLTDSSYTIADARKDAGTIRTANRKDSDTQRGAAQLRSMMFDHTTRLTFVISPIGADSSRISIVGEYIIMDKLAKIDARGREWPYVSNIGQAILTAIR